jgi:hypothetical protein
LIAQTPRFAALVVGLLLANGDLLYDDRQLMEGILKVG